MGVVDPLHMLNTVRNVVTGIVDDAKTLAPKDCLCAVLGTAVDLPPEHAYRAVYLWLLDNGCCDGPCSGRLQQGKGSRLPLPLSVPPLGPPGH
ncbi:hypothetical protein CBOM_03690 [Ceraceosorus bombacis]|uniref:Uncharacterized protein n=1 Tax=Ceraceosorus bombacis TaxID=401625 RepID=A0A0P1BGR5_9BASI|nr:hypothetical protein CBOM_03690 [Ceraceosorus bombacis]